jgi:hypothetical protein
MPYTVCVQVVYKLGYRHAHRCRKLDLGVGRCSRSTHSLSLGRLLSLLITVLLFNLELTYSVKTPASDQHSNILAWISRIILS